MHNIDYLLKKVVKTKDCWLWIGCKDKMGYGIAGFMGRIERVHRVFYLIFNGDFNKSLYVLHKCDVRNCVNPEHLFLGTQNDNMKDMVKKGRHYKAKLSINDIKFIRLLYISGLKLKPIRNFYHLHLTTLHNIISYKTWKHVEMVSQ